MPSYYLHPLPVQPRNQPAARPVYHSPPGGSVVICKPISQQHRVYRYICQANGPRLRLSPLSLPPKRINVFLAIVVAVTLPTCPREILTDLLIVSPRANTDNGAVSTDVPVNTFLATVSALRHLTPHSPADFQFGKELHWLSE